MPGDTPAASPTRAELAPRGHIRALDGVRGLAIFMVLAHNFDVVSSEKHAADVIVGGILDRGWVGVQLFFVLSGFLITGALLDSRGSRNYYAAFFGRRTLRVFPLYYATLFVAFVVLPLVAAHPPDGRHQIWLWTYLSNFASPFGREVTAFPHFWSLAVEEQFYLVWPLVVRPRSEVGLAMTCGALVLAALAIRTGLLLGGVGEMAVYMWTVCRMDALAAGAAVAALLRVPSVATRLQGRESRIGWCAGGLLVAACIVTRGYPRTSFLTQTAGYAALSLVFAALVLVAVLSDARGSGALHGLLAAAPLRALGKYSYAMYVFHVPIHLAIGQRVLSQWVPEGEPVGLGVGLAYFAGATAATFAAGVASYHLFEKRFLAMKRWFVPESAGAGVG